MRRWRLLKFRSAVVRISRGASRLYVLTDERSIARRCRRPIDPAFRDDHAYCPEVRSSLRVIDAEMSFEERSELAAHWRPRACSRLATRNRQPGLCCGRAQTRSVSARRRLAHPVCLLRLRREQARRAGRDGVARCRTPPRPFAWCGCPYRRVPACAAILLAALGDASKA